MGRWEAREPQERCQWEKGPHDARGPRCSKKRVALHKNLDSPGKAPYHTPVHRGI